MTCLTLLELSVTVYDMDKLLRIGIFFGGGSREQEVSLAGGRTVYDNLDRALFTPVPIFVDQWGRLILLQWQHLYKGTIRDFYPPNNYKGSDFYRDSCLQPQLFDEIGTHIATEDLKAHIDVAFLVLHGTRGEDGSIQGVLEWVGVPYVGAGIYAAALGMDKAKQRLLMAAGGFSVPKYVEIKRKNWLQKENQAQILDAVEAHFLGRSCVTKPANEGSSIGVKVVSSAERSALRAAIYAAFFIEEVSVAFWQAADHQVRKQLIDRICDLRKGPGLPLYVEDFLINESNDLYTACEHAATVAGGATHFYVYGQHSEHTVLVEEFIQGREFSCILVEDAHGHPIVLPPTEIQNKQNCYDYRAKYLPGIVRKHTPMVLSKRDWEAIAAACKELYSFLGCEVYARIDGFLQPSGHVLLNDPNTTSGMMPSSFLFHQAAEVGLSPTALLTYLLHRSLEHRIEKEKQPHMYGKLLAELQKMLKNLEIIREKKTKVAIITGGASSERHIAIESARNVYEKFSSSQQYLPRAIFLLGNVASAPMYSMPLSLLLKDNADDIAESLKNPAQPPEWLDELYQSLSFLRVYYGEAPVFASSVISYGQLAEEVDAVFLALHGRPGEDGSVQQKLDAVGLPYNGSSPHSAAITIDKYKTVQALRAAGLQTTQQWLVTQEDVEKIGDALWRKIETQFDYPMIAKPVDEGCSTAVRKLDSREELAAYAAATFSDAAKSSNILSISSKTSQFLIEKYVQSEESTRFLEITVGLLNRTNTTLGYEVFAPSEVLVRDNILSLEEKFLTGEGQNITPACFSDVPETQAAIMKQVQDTVAQAARALNIEGYARIDAFVRIKAHKTEVIIIEVNALPGLTAATCLFHQAALSGYTPCALLSIILETGMKRQHKMHHD